LGAKRIRWYDNISHDIVRGGFSQASKTNIGGWNGYYPKVARSEGVNTVVTDRIYFVCGVVI